MVSINQMRCCGVKEISGVSITSPHQVVHRVYQNNGGNAYAGHFIFTATGRSQYGYRLATFIEAHQLGTVTSSEYARNPNSGNRVKVWVWQPSWDNIRQYTQQYPVRRSRLW